jgi:hypothetical protein
MRKETETITTNSTALKQACTIYSVHFEGVRGADLRLCVLTRRGGFEGPQTQCYSTSVQVVRLRSTVGGIRVGVSAWWRGFL